MIKIDISGFYMSINFKKKELNVNMLIKIHESEKDET